MVEIIERYRNRDWERKNARMVDPGQTGAARRGRRPAVAAPRPASSASDRAQIEPRPGRDRCCADPDSWTGRDLLQAFRLCHSRIRRFFAVWSPLRVRPAVPVITAGKPAAAPWPTAADEYRHATEAKTPGRRLATWPGAKGPAPMSLGNLRRQARCRRSSADAWCQVQRKPGANVRRREAPGSVCPA